MCNVAQICGPVINLIAVDMVDYAFWPASIDVKPCKPVRLPNTPSNSYPDVPAAAYVASNSANANVVVLTGAFHPYENTCLWIVVKKFAQTLCGKIGLSHDAPRMLI